MWTCVSTADGTLKSRLVLLGHLMPKDDELDISSPTPRLSSVRILLALAIKLDLVCEIVDIDTAFTYAMPHTTIYASIPGGLCGTDCVTTINWAESIYTCYATCMAQVDFLYFLCCVCINVTSVGTTLTAV